jgi:gluconolactonase
LADGATLTLLTDDCDFTEGPAANSKGEVFFTDQPNDRILKIGLDDSVTEFLKPAGRSNGMAFDANDNLIACADGDNQMWVIDSSGNHETLFEGFESKRLNGPNDLWIHPDGWIYFTDPFYKRPWWNHSTMPQEGQFIYRVRRDGSEIERLPFEFKQPNGIIGDAKKGILYVADIGDSKTYRFSISKSGELTDKKLFCEMGSDGMTIDTEGNVYLTNAAGVTVFDSAGKKVETIAIPLGWTANVCFGGADNNRLFITASTSVFVIDTKQTGL